MADNIETSRLNSALHQVKYADNLKRDLFKELEILLLQQKGHDNLNYDFKILYFNIWKCICFCIRNPGKMYPEKEIYHEMAGGFSFDKLTFQEVL